MLSSFTLCQPPPSALYPGTAMATERQIQANRTNAAKSTGPRTPAGKPASSQSSTRHNSMASTVVLHGESIGRFDELAAALTLQFDPRNSTEAFLVQTMIVARWRLLRLWGMQTAGFELEMARTAESHPSLTTGPVLAAVAFRNLADNSRVLALQLRLEAAYHREFSRALASLLKLRQTPDSGIPADPPLLVATGTWDDDSQTEPTPTSDPAAESPSSQQVAEVVPTVPAEPIPTLPASPPPVDTCRASTARAGHRPCVNVESPRHGARAAPTSPLTDLLCSSKIALEDLTMQ